MQVVEQHSVAKSTTTPSEDAVVVTAYYAAVIDGPTPKTAFRYPSGETPGQLAARLISEAIRLLPPDATALSAMEQITQAMHQEDVQPCDRPIASCVIYSAWRREVWLVGDCQFATLSVQGVMQCIDNPKRIDHILADWRRAIVTSYLSRGVMTQDEIMAQDPGRRIIQPHITRQVKFQNSHTGHPLSYCMLDGEPVDEGGILIYPLAQDIELLILATDGYPVLLPTLAASEARLAELLTIDPLCIGPLMGTKGIRPGNLSYDDRTYLRISI